MPRKPPATVEEYLASFPETERATLEAVRSALRAALPEAQERVSYGVIRLDVEGMHPLYFGGWKKHVGIYPVPIASEAGSTSGTMSAANAELELEIAPYRSAKDSLHFSYDTPMPLELIQRVAAYIVQQNPNPNPS